MVQNLKFGEKAVLSALIGSAVLLLLGPSYATQRLETAVLERVAQTQAVLWSNLLRDEYIDWLADPDLLSVAGSTATSTTRVSELGMGAGRLTGFRLVDPRGFVLLATDGQSVGRLAAGYPTNEIDRWSAREATLLPNDTVGGAESGTGAPSEHNVAIAQAYFPMFRQGRFLGGLELTLDLGQDAAAMGSLFDRVRWIMIAVLGLFLIGAGCIAYRGLTQRRAAARHALAAADERAADQEETSRHLTILSHEARVNLTTVMGFAEIIKDEIFGPIGLAKYRDYASAIHESGLQLTGLVAKMAETPAPEIEAETPGQETVAIVPRGLDVLHGGYGAPAPAGR